MQEDLWDFVHVDVFQIAVGNSAAICLTTRRKTKRNAYVIYKIIFVAEQAVCCDSDFVCSDTAIQHTCYCLKKIASKDVPWPAIRNKSWKMLFPA